MFYACFSWQNRHQCIFRRLLAVAAVVHLLANLACTAVFLNAASHNYPGKLCLITPYNFRANCKIYCHFTCHAGGSALWHLHRLEFGSRLSARTVHIDVFCAQSGVSRFAHEYDAWTYVLILRDIEDFGQYACPIPKISINFSSPYPALLVVVMYNLSNI